MVGTTSYWTPNRTAIYTDVVVSVAEQYKGDVGASQVVVMVQGGEVGPVGLRVSDMPVFKEGEEVILFLDKAGPVYAINSLYQGKYTVKEGVVAENELPAVEFVRDIRETLKMLEK